MKLRPIINKKNKIQQRNKKIALEMGAIGFIIGTILFVWYLVKFLW